MVAEPPGHAAAAVGAVVDRTLVEPEVVHIAVLRVVVVRTGLVVGTVAEVVRILVAEVVVVVADPLVVRTLVDPSLVVVVAAAAAAVDHTAAALHTDWHNWCWD